MNEILENDYFIINEENGTSKKYSTLFTFYNQQYKKNYVVYCDYLEDDTVENDESNVYASIYNPDDLNLNLIEILDNDELWMVKQQIDEIMNTSMQETSIYEQEVGLDE